MFDTYLNIQYACLKSFDFQCQSHCLHMSYSSTIDLSAMTHHCSEQDITNCCALLQYSGTKCSKWKNTYQGQT